MSFDREAWKADILETIRAKTQAYTLTDKDNFRIATVAKLTEKNATLPISDAEAEENNLLINGLVNTLPLTPDPKRKDVIEYYKLFDDVIGKFKEKYNLVRKGYYQRTWLPLGVAIGLPWGVAAGNIALGLPIGMVIGLLLGSYLDNKAAKEGRAV